MSVWCHNYYTRKKEVGTDDFRVVPTTAAADHFVQIIGNSWQHSSFRYCSLGETLNSRFTPNWAAVSKINHQKACCHCTTSMCYTTVSWSGVLVITPNELISEKYLRGVVQSTGTLHLVVARQARLPQLQGTTLVAKLSQLHRSHFASSTSQASSTSFVLPSATVAPWFFDCTGGVAAYSSFGRHQHLPHPS